MTIRKFALLGGVLLAAATAPAHAQLGVFGCRAEGNKQETAAVIGGVVGAVLGNRIGGRGGRTEGTLIGGALGAAAGSAVGCKLQKNDQAKAEAAMQEALNTGRDQEWRGDSGAWGEIDVGSDIVATDLGNLRFARGVEPADGYARISRAYASTARVNVRAAPATNAAVLGQLATGQRVWVPAQVRGQPWLLVSDNGVAQGYVAASLLRPSTAATAARGCRMVKQTVNLPGGGAESETYQACKDANGEWALTRV